ncbi:MAG: hypothetical protein II940_04910 [Methanosarcinaceae archaeon]|nr:hypothetical protein [Methanosarcinaceae archaeon]
MDIQSFVRKAGSRLHRYRVTYRILDVILTTLFFYAVSVFLNLDAFFLLIKPIEPYVGLTIDIGEYAVRYEMIGLLIPAFIFALIFLFLVRKIRPYITRRRFSEAAEKTIRTSGNVREKIRRKKIERRIAKARKAAGKPVPGSGEKKSLLSRFGKSGKGSKGGKNSKNIPEYARSSSAVTGSRAKKTKKAKVSASAVCISDALDMIETRYPSLKYRLRTAYDNAGNSNFISEDLSSKVSEEIRGVSLSCLLNKRKVLFDSAAIFILAVLIIAVIVTGVSSPVDMSGLVGDLQSGTDEKPLNMEMSDPDFGGPDNDPSSSSSESSIASPPTIAQAPGTPVNVTLPPGSGIGPGSELDAENASEVFGPSVNYDPTILAAGHYQENLPEGYESLIRQYFEKMAQSSRSPKRR